jgi:hypothetical protein
MEMGIADMVAALDAAAVQSQDLPDGPHISVSEVTHTGKRGRPRIEVDPTFLAFALDMRGPTGIAPVLGCAPRTVRRRALEHGLVDPGPPVYIDLYDADNDQTLRTYTSSTPAMATLTDDELDCIIHAILEIFPAFGRRMIEGHLLQLGHRVPRERLRASYNRVHGAPSSFSNRPIQRRCHFPNIV